MSTRRSFWIALSAVILLTALFRALYLQNPMLWTDEYFSLMFTTGHLDDPFPANQIVESAPDVSGLRDAKPIWELPRAMRADTHPPLFPIALRLWREAFGESEFIARLFMLVCSLIGAGLLFDSLRRQVSISAGVLAGVFYAMSVPMVSYGVEIRNYGMMTTLVLAAVHTLVRIEKTGFTIQRAILLGLFSIGALLTHYFAFAPIAALGLYCLIRFQKQLRIRVIATLAITMFAFAAIQLPSFFAQKTQFDTNLDWLQDPSRQFLLPTFVRSLTSLCRSFTFDVASNQIMILVSIGLLALFVIRRSKPMLLWALLAGATLYQCVETDLITGRATTNFIRYALPAVPAILALAAIAFSSITRVEWQAIPIILLAIMLWSNMKQFIETGQHRPQWHQVYRQMRDSDLNSSDTIVFIRHPHNPWYTKILYASFCAEVGRPISRVVVLDDDKSISIDSSARLFIVSDPTEKRTDLQRNRPLLWEYIHLNRSGKVADIQAFGPTQ